MTAYVTAHLTPDECGAVVDALRTALAAMPVDDERFAQLAAARAAVNGALAAHQDPAA